MQKRSFLTLMMAIMVAAISFAAPYAVNCKSTLNVRAGMSTQAPVLMALNNGDLIEVNNIQGDWAEIQYGNTTAYVSAKYIVPAAIEEPVQAKSDEKSSGILDNLGYKYFGDMTWLLFLILPMFVLLFIFQKKLEEEGDWSDLRNLAIVALVASILEIIYAMGSQDFSWFCVEPAWYIIAINFVLFALCAYAQLLSYTTFTGFVSDGRGQLAIYSWPACLVLGIILYFCDESTDWAFYALLVAQLIQTGIIFVTLNKYRSAGSAIIYSLVYLLFTLATAILLIQFIVLLIIVLIALFVLAALGHGSTSSSSSGSYSSSSNSSGSGDSYEEKYSTQDGYDLHYDGFGNWHDDRGRHYHNTGAWGGRDMVRTDDD